MQTNVGPVIGPVTGIVFIVTGNEEVVPIPQAFASVQETVPPEAAQLM